METVSFVILWKEYQGPLGTLVLTPLLILSVCVISLMENYDEHYASEDELLELKVPKSGLKTEAPKIPKGFEDRENWKWLIVILEQANLETCKSKKGLTELINCDDH